MGYNMSEHWHGVILMMQCLRHTDRSAVGGQAWTPGCWCVLLTDIDFFWGKALCGCVGDYYVLFVDMWRMSGIFRGLRPHTMAPWKSLGICLGCYVWIKPSHFLQSWLSESGYPSSTLFLSTLFYADVQYAVAPLFVPVFFNYPISLGLNLSIVEPVFSPFSSHVWQNKSYSNYIIVVLL